MKKIMLLLCYSLLPWIARGQVAFDWYYWFDSDYSVKSNGKSTNDSFSIITDVSGLSQGFHTIHVQIADKTGVFSSPRTEYFYHMTDRSIAALRYWFDNDMEHMQTIYASGSTYTIDVSSLEPGLHYIYCQIEDESGNFSDVVRNGFYRQIRPTAITWTYWFDEDERTKETVPYPGEMVMIDVSSLSEGFHTIHSQVQELTPFPAETRMFVKIPQSKGTDNMTCICTIDGKLVAREDIPAQGGIMQWNLNVDSLGVGIHKAMFQTITKSGAASLIAERYFVRTLTSKELGGMKCVYSLDNFQSFAKAGTLSNGVFHFDLDVSSMEEGLHRIAYMLISEDGNATDLKTAFFWKTPLGGPGIVKYEYWINESNSLHSVELPERANPLSLVELLPVDSDTIRSCCFHFEEKEGIPTMFAKNIFNIAFYDVTGRRVEASKPYVDYSVSQSVNEILPLRESQSFGKTIDNEVKWFYFEAAKGDTVSFKTSQTASMNLFSASGKELYSVSGDNSTIYGGARILEDGKHYIAVHDVTGSKADITLYYKHLDYSDIYINREILLANEHVISDSIFDTKPSMMLVYNSDMVTERGRLTVENDATISLGKYVQTVNWGYYNNTSKYSKTGVEYYHPTTLVNHGFMRADNVVVKQNLYRDKWHFVSFPFNVKMADIRMPEGTYFAIRKYDGEQRATGNKSNVWYNLGSNDVMEAKQGYIVQLTSEFNDKAIELTFPAINDAKKNNIFSTGNSEIKLEDYPSEFAHNRSWNLIGNPYPCFYDTRYMDVNGTITVWNGSGYSAYSIQDDNYILMPFEAFFIQKPLNDDKILFLSDGKQHSESVRNEPNRAKKHKAANASNRIIYNLKLTNGEYTDASRIVFNDESSIEYECDKDAVKFMEQQPKTPQLYSNEGGVKYAINERPTNDGIVSLSVFVPEDGTYSLSLEDAPSEVFLIDTENNAKIVLSEDDYSFQATKGSHEGRFIIALNGAPTSITNITNSNEGDIRVVNNELSFNFISECNIKVFGIDGTKYYQDTIKSDRLRLNTGVYIIEVNGKATKVAVK